MSYDYERSVISKGTGLTGVQADHIAKKLRELEIDPQTIDWEGAISDARDYGNRYEAVKRYIANYYGIDLDAKSVAGYHPEEFELAGMIDVVATKQGVKQILKEYYETKSKQKKEAMKEALLTEGPLRNVLMTAMYDGIDMPNARKFLNEVMGEQIIQSGLTQPTVIKHYVAKAPIVTPQPTKQQPSISGPDEWPKTLRNGQKFNKEVLKSKSTVNIEDIYKMLLEKKPEKATTPQAMQPQPVFSQKPQAKDMIIAGIMKEGKLWKKLLSQGIVPKRGSPEFLRMQVAQLRAQNLPLQLQLEKERLLMQREQMIELKKMQEQRQRGSSTALVLSWFGFLPPQQMMEGPLHRPGYYIESRPKLPPGFRWKKTPKRKQKQPQIMVY